MKFATVHISLMLDVTHLNVDLIGVCHVDQHVMLIIDNHHEMIELCASHERLAFLVEERSLRFLYMQYCFFYSLVPRLTSVPG